VTQLDSALLNAAEWSCQKFQVLTGRTNVWLAVQLTNLSIVLYFVWAAVAFARTDLWLRVSVGVFCAALLYALTQTIFKVSIEESETNAYRRVAKGLRNPRRIRDAQLRMSFLTLSMFMSSLVGFLYLTLHLPVALLSYSLIVLTTALLYLLACDPLPPCTGKVREWLGLLQSAPSRAEESVTEQ
jgi:hypothetical protein